MTAELPVLRLGLAGFAAAAQERFRQLLQRLPDGVARWEIVALDQADAWWVNGARTQQLDDGTLRVASGVPSGRSLHLNLAEIERPVAFSQPLAARGVTPEFVFDPESTPSLAAVLIEFESRLRPLTAQFVLAAQILAHETALGPGNHQVVAAGKLLAHVNLQGDASVLTTVGPADFEGAMWVARALPSDPLPRTFVQTSLSRLMWQYALRTQRDLLPPRYRSCTLYFRRPPRLPQRLLRDSHLLVIRELAVVPCTLDELHKRTSLPPELLARDLAALYLVGSITSNPRRAVWSPAPRREGTDSGLLHSQVPVDGATELQGLVPQWNSNRPPDMTAPAPISLG